MGACASVPKAMRGEEGDAPLPAPQKEEATTTPTTTATTEVAEAAPVETTDKEVKVADEEEKKVAGGDDEKKEVAEENSGDKVVEENPSLGSLLNDQKETPKEEKAKGEELPISDPEKVSTAAPVEVEKSATTTAPVAQAEVKKTEEVAAKK